MRQAYDYWQDQPGFYQQQSTTRNKPCCAKSRLAASSKGLNSPARRKPPRPNLVLDHVSSRLEDQKEHLRREIPLIPSLRCTKPKLRASNPEESVSFTPDTHTSSQDVTRAGNLRQARTKHPAPRRLARHDRTRTNPRQRSYRQEKVEYSPLTETTDDE